MPLKTTVLDKVPPLSSVAEPKKRKMLNSCKDINVVEGEVNDQENLVCGDNGSTKECPKTREMRPFFFSVDITMEMGFGVQITRHRSLLFSNKRLERDV